MTKRLNSLLQESGPLDLNHGPDFQPDDSFFAGIDVGSRTTKAVILKGRRLIASAVLNTGVNPKQAAESVLFKAKDQADMGNGRIGCMVGTGYGRVSLSFVNKTVTELTCHGRGCHFINPEIRTVIDIGGQDTKIIRLNQNGDMVDFLMNDKCAAGTGKFLEMIAGALEMDLGIMGHIDPKFGPPCVINSMCAVFAESEVISLLSEGHRKEVIAAGIVQAFAKRVVNQAKRIGIDGKVAFVGGAAKNRGLRKALEDFLNIEFVIMDIDPQIVGALGAALIAKETA